MAMGMGIPGGYAGRGTTDTDRDTYFSIRPHTRTHTRRTHTRNSGFALLIHTGLPNQAITKRR